MATERPHRDRHCIVLTTSPVPLTRAEAETLAALRELLGEARGHIRDACRTGRRSDARHALSKLDTAVAVWCALRRLVQPTVTRKRKVRP